MKILITGGAGFIGSNTANYYLGKGDAVTIYDNMSRRGVEKNIKWLTEKSAGSIHELPLRIIVGDIRDFDKLVRVIDDVDIIYHFASQVAVTTSVANPRDDFEINALGTLNVLEAMRKINKDRQILVFTSTNKVYGAMEDIQVVCKENRYEYKELKEGVSENRNLNFHSPYACSKGAADQYVQDYARIYGLKTVVFRLSCIYGPRQFGCEDQGWVAHFIISSVLGKELTIYGDGMQTRDILFIDDLIEAFEQVVKKIDKICGKVYNIGGGPENTLSLLELIAKIGGLLNKKINYSFSQWRPGDQKVYVSDIRRAKEELGWVPKVNIDKGISKLIEWVIANKELF
ncbi:MAG: GDP-mannose 4,6-dehydratase [bacterium]|nr:GDP-mannose 4,6-dehydratase [bacterium]